MTDSTNVLDVTKAAAHAAADKIATDVVAFDVSEQLAITDIFLIVSANNERLVGAIVEAIEEELIRSENTRPTRRDPGPHAVAAVAARRDRLECLRPVPGAE